MAKTASDAKEPLTFEQYMVEKNKEGDDQSLGSGTNTTQMSDLKIDPTNAQARKSIGALPGSAGASQSQQRQPIQFNLHEDDDDGSDVAPVHHGGAGPSLDDNVHVALNERKGQNTQPVHESASYENCFSSSYMESHKPPVKEPQVGKLVPGSLR